MNIVMDSLDQVMEDGGQGQGTSTSTSGSSIGLHEHEHEDEPPSNFTHIHEKKRLPQRICYASLCPTMDLVAIGLSSKTHINTNVNINAKINFNANNNNTTNNSNLSGGGGDSGSKSSGNGIDDFAKASVSESVSVSAATSITVYRTISWQKMFVVTQADLSSALSNKFVIDDPAAVAVRNGKANEEEKGEDMEEEKGGDIEEEVQMMDSNIIDDSNLGGNDDDNDDDDDDDGSNSDSNPYASYVTWSPDGRTLAIGLTNGSTLLYDIESSASPGVPPQPIVCIPAPPSPPPSLLASSSSLSPIISTSLGSLSESESTSSLTSSSQTITGTSTGTGITARITRSMTIARRKRLMRMAGKTPEEEEVEELQQQQQQQLQQLLQQKKKKQPHRQNIIVGLKWLRYNPYHKDWNMTTMDSWYFQSYYLDKATFFLPPSGYNSTYPKQYHVKNGTTYNLHSNAFNSSIVGVGGHGSSGGGGNGSRSSSRHLSENLDHHQHDFEESIDRYRPQCQTPLSILLTLTSNNGLHLYLHGRYRILSVTTPSVLRNVDTKITVSSDLSQIMICAAAATAAVNSLSNTNTDPTTTSATYQHQVKMNTPKTSNDSILTLYTIPAIIQNKHPLQIISSSYCSIMSHLTILTKGSKEVYNSWSGSLRQLDMKFDQLFTLLTKYGVTTTTNTDPSTSTTTSTSTLTCPTIDKMIHVRIQLLNYILGGHSKRSTDTSNAMDQFFTHPLMNDQLLQRLVRSLEANVAGVESLIRKKILGPVRALLYDVGELNGLVKMMNIDNIDHDYNDNDGIDNDYDSVDNTRNENIILMDEHTSLRLYEASEVLFFVAEQCVSQMVEIRFRLTSIMKWIRGTASQVKARGTAADSVQRDNAKKRRVPEHTLKTVADFLSTTLKSEKGSDGGGDDEDDTLIKRGSSECIMGILFSDYFCKDKVYIDLPSAELKSHNDNLNHYLGGSGNGSGGVNNYIESPSIKAALEISTQIARDLFDEPRVAMNNAVKQTNIVLEECAKGSHQNNSAISVHSRIGSSPYSIDDDVENCFSPNLSCLPDNGEQLFNRQWSIVANSCSTEIDGDQLLQVSALPGGYRGSYFSDMDIFDSDAYDSTASGTFYYLTTFIILPKGRRLCNIDFYGDDGNSTLTSETSPKSEEGRQALGLLLENVSIEDSITQELWMFQYDNLDFRVVSFPWDKRSGEVQIQKFDESIDQYCHLMNDVDAKWRQVRSQNLHNSSSQMFLSGSRGIGGVTCNRTNTVDLYDLEDDEEDDDDEDSDEE